MLILILWSAFCFLFCFSYPSGIRVLYKTEFILPLFIYREIFYSTSCRYIASWLFSFSGKGGRKGRLAKTTPLRFANFYLVSRGRGDCCFLTITIWLIWFVKMPRCLLHVHFTFPQILLPGKQLKE